MGYNVLQEAVNKNKEHKKKHVWYRIVTCMAALVVFCTTYALILPAITLDDKRTCGIENHEHDDVICYIDTEKDVETESQWKANLPLPLTGDYRTDLIAMAESQLNYSESLRNLTIDEEEGVLRGYTRYGARAEDPYGDWNRYFVSFCLYYAGIDEEAFPQSADYAEWIELLQAKGLYQTPEEYTPCAGDILFLDSDNDGTADRVAVVTERSHKNGSTLKIKVIEGDVGGTDNRFTKTQIRVTADGTILPNGTVVSGGDILNGETTIPGENTAFTSTVSDGDSMITTVTQYHAPENYAGGKVQYVEYAADDANIVGYGVLPKQPLVYTFSDDNVKVVVKLPEDSSVPAGAVLKVTPIESADENYDSLTEQAENALEGEVKQIYLYDISFYTAEDEYIPVDDQAKVTIRFKESMVDSNADVKVLHYDEEENVPVVLEEVTIEEQEIVAEGTGLSVTDTATVNSEETELETVVAFETAGFSTFAVVEIETGTYMVGIETLKPSANGNKEDNLPTVSDLANKTFVIVTQDKEYAISSVNYVMNEGEDGNNDKLKGMSVLDSDDTTVTVNANKHLRWRFEPTGETGTVYICSEATGKYMNIIKNGILTTSDTPQKITVVMNGDKVGFCVEVEEEYYYVDRANGEDYFHTWVGGIDNATLDANRMFILYRYDDDDHREIGNPVTEGVDTDSLIVDGNAYIIAAVNFKSNVDKKDGVVLRGQVTDAQDGLIGGNVDNVITYDDNDNVINIPLGNITDGVWIFEDAGDDAYYIRSAKYDKYLHISTDVIQGSTTKMGLSDEKQAFKTETGTTQNWNTNDVKNVECLYTTIGNDKYYVNLFENSRNENFLGNKSETGNSDRGNHLLLLDVGKLVSGLENKSYLISGVNFKGNNNYENEAVIMSSTKLGDGKYMDGVQGAKVTVENETVKAISHGEAALAAWHFEYAGALGTYYVKSLATGEYLNISGDGLTTGNTAQAIEVVESDTSTQTRPIKNNVISLRSAADHSLYVQLYGNKYVAEEGDGLYTAEFTSAKSTEALIPTLRNGGNHLVLTEYIERAEFATDLGGKVYFIVAKNNGDGSQADRPPLLGSTPGTTAQPILSGENRDIRILSESGYIEDVNGDGVISEDEKIDTKSNLGWLFEATDTPGIYHLMAVNGDANINGVNNAGKYLNISAKGLTMQDTPQDIEVVKGIPEKEEDDDDVICFRANVDGVYYYVHLQENSDAGNFTSFTGTNLTSARSNHFGLSEVKSVNDTIMLINDVLENLVETEAGSYIFSDSAFTGSAGIDNKNTNQRQGVGSQNSDPTFVDNYEQARAYRTEMQDLAREAYKMYTEKLSESEQSYVYNADILIEKLKWLWAAPATVEATEVEATVKLFNYDGTANDPNSGKSNASLLSNGYRFYHKKDYDSYTAIVDANRYNSGELGCDGSTIYMHDSLDKNGYPSVKGNDKVTFSDTDGSLQFLFDDTTTYHVATMEKGGGLFRLDESTGFYYYRCNENAAYYNKSANSFILYDTVVRPMYIHGTDPNADDDIYNFLPFNNPAESAIFDDPIDAQTGNTAYLNERPDMWFGMTLEFDFVMPAGGKVDVPDKEDEMQDMIFKFKGDDDVLVYIDGKLVMDLSGVHGAEEGIINFASGKVTDKYGKERTTLAEIFSDVQGATNGDTLADNTVHKLQFFYMERGGNVSYNSIQFNIDMLPTKALTVGKELAFADNAGSTEAIQNKYYTFRVVQADEENNPILQDEKEVSYFVEGTQYKIIDSDGNDTGTYGTVDENGYFYLRAGYSAKFEDILNEEKRANLQCSNYIVQEILPEEEKGQYEDVEYTVITTDEGGTETSNKTYPMTLQGNAESTSLVYNSGSISTGYDTQVTVRNKVADTSLGKLQITKTLAGSVDDTTAEFTFKVQVKLGDRDVGDGGDQYMQLLPVGTAYTLTDENGNTGQQTVKEAGYIYLKPGQTATIANILAGTDFEVTEIIEEEQRYTPSYKGEILGAEVDQNGNAVTIKPETQYGVDGAEDEVGNGHTAKVTITNAPYDFSAKIPITKAVMYGTQADNFNFITEQYIRADADGKVQFTKAGSGDAQELPVTGVTVVPGETNSASGEIVTPPGGNGEIVIAYDINTVGDGPYYYMVREQNEGKAYIYDRTVYMVEVSINSDGEAKKATITRIWKKSNVDSTEDWEVFYDASESSADATASDVPALSFVNHRTTSVIVKKTIASGDTSKKFKYDLVIKDEDGAILDIAPEDSSFELSDGEQHIIEGIPIGAVVTVTEQVTDEYTESYMVTSRYEAEYGRVNVNDVAADNNASGQFYVGNLGNENTVIIDVPYQDDVGVSMYLGYANEATTNVTAEHSFEYSINGETPIKQPVTDRETWTRSDAIPIMLKGDANTISIGNSTGVAPNLDYIDLEFHTTTGNVAQVNVLGDTTTIHFINATRYKIPETGGEGTKPYILGGAITTISALAFLLLYNKKRRRKKVNVPS